MNKERLFDLMVREAEYSRDRCSIGADGRQGEDLGVSRTTIWRWKCQLREAGLIKHDGYHVWNERLPSGYPKRTARWVFPQGVRRLRETQRSSNRSSTPSRPSGLTSHLRFRSSNVYGGPGSRRAQKSRPPHQSRRRRLMEEHPEVLAGGLVRKDGTVTPFNAGDAVALATDVCRTMGFPLAPSIRARLGKGAKGLLEAEFDPQLVVAACVTAVRTGWFGSVESIGQEMAVAATGNRQTRHMYQQALSQISAHLETSESPVWQLMRDELERREMAKKRGLES